MPGTKRLIGRDAKLLIVKDQLSRLSKRSQLIDVKPVDERPGRLPETYLVTFKVKSIIGIKEDDEPIFGDFHQVEIYLQEGFPRQEPKLKWLTPIWHPNIDHLEPKAVCTHQIISWSPQKDMEQLVIELAEMAQYKTYHAEAKKPDDPQPKDTKVAQWIIEYAEPRGIIGPNKPTDKRQLTSEVTFLSRVNEKKLRNNRATAKSDGFHAGKKVTIENWSQPRRSASTVDPNYQDLLSELEPLLGKDDKFTIGKPVKVIICNSCGKRNIIEGSTREQVFCEDCHISLIPQK